MNTEIQYNLANFNPKTRVHKVYTIEVQVRSVLPVKYPYQPYIFTFMQLVALSTGPKAPEHHLVFDVDHTPGKARSKPKEDT